jgi:hypothetical protein
MLALGLSSGHGNNLPRGTKSRDDSFCLKSTGRWVVRYGFLFKSPAGRTVVAGVLVDDAGFCEARGVGVAAGRLEFSFVMTESLKS